MTPPNVPFERIDHFRSRLKLGDEDTVISRAHLGDVRIYLAHALQDGATEAASRLYIITVFFPLKGLLILPDNA